MSREDRPLSHWRDELERLLEASEDRDPNDVRTPINKAPRTDPAKASKAGRRAVVHANGRYASPPASERPEGQPNLLQPVWRDGKLLRRWTFDEVRSNAALSQVKRDHDAEAWNGLIGSTKAHR